MTEPASPPPSKKKQFLLLLAVFAVFYTVAPYLLGGVLSVIYPRTEVAFDTTLRDAKVTDVWMNRQYYLYYLDGNTWQMHDFIGFGAADPAARTGMNDTIGWDPSDLSHYLRRGDRITKAANSPLLTVQRNIATTRWILYTYMPEAQRPPPVKIFLLDGDTVVIP